MIYFAQPQFLLLILLIPLFLLGYGVARYARKLRIRRFGDEALVKELMPSWSRSKGWVKVVIFCLAFLFFVVGLAHPLIGAKLSQHSGRGSEVMILLDVSNSMLAEDYSPNRLERSKLAISRIVDKLHEDRIGLVIFAGTPFVQLPVTTDYVSAKMFMSSITTGSIPIQGTAIGEAINLAVKCFNPDLESGKAIIVITDGENHEDDPVAEAKAAADQGIRVFTIGVGSPEGQPIPVNGELLKDSNGDIVVSRLDEETLKDIAAAGNGAYVHAGNEEFGLNPILDEIRRMEKEEFSSVMFEEYDEQYMYFMWIAFALLVLEMLIGRRKPKVKLF